MSSTRPSIPTADYATDRKVSVSGGDEPTARSAADVADPHVQVAVRVPTRDSIGRAFHIIRFRIGIEPGFARLCARYPVCGVALWIGRCQAEFDVRVAAIIEEGRADVVIIAVLRLVILVQGCDHLLDERVRDVLSGRIPHHMHRDRDRGDAARLAFTEVGRTGGEVQIGRQALLLEPAFV
jgi:hypothetical protein